MTGQQSLDRYTDSITLRERYDGKHKAVVDTLPDEDHTKVKQSTSEVGKTDRDYPLERDRCVVKRFEEWGEGRGPRATLYNEFKVVEVDIDRESHPSEAERVEDLFDTLRELPGLEEAVDQFDTYDALTKNAETVRRYESVYSVVQNIWHKDSIKRYATNDLEPRMFEIDQAPQGFYHVPMLHHRAANNVIGEKLESEDVGTYSIVWGGYIVEPSEFDRVHDLLEPFYRTPGDVR
jgi:hypothetical protein